MIIDLVLIFLGIIGLIIATYSDIKTTEIPNWISYFLIISGMSLRVLHSLTFGDFSFTFLAIVNLAIFFIIGNLMYYTKQWGGGDVKVLMGLSVIFATYPETLTNIFSPKLDNFYFPITIFINILVIGAIYSILYTIYAGIKHKKEFSKEFKLYLSKTKKSRKNILILSILMIVLSFFLKDITKIFLVLSAIAIILLLYFWIYLKSIEKSCMYKTLSPSKLIEGDWLIKNIYKNKKLILRIPKYGITKEQIESLKRHRIKKIDIKQGIAFMPAFLIATIASLIFGSLINHFL